MLSQDDYWELKRNKVPEQEIVAKTANNEFVADYLSERLQVIESIEYLRHDRLQPGIQELLNELAKEQELTLVTLRNRRENLMWELNHFNLGFYFANILTKEDNHGDYRIKMELISGFCGSDNAQGVLIGDTEADIRAARELGLISCGVTFGIRTEKYIRNLRPDYIADSVVSMGEIIREVVSK